MHCGKTTDRIRQPFGTIGRTGPEMRQVLGFDNRSTGRGTFGGEFGAHNPPRRGPVPKLLCGDLLLIEL